jgi:hypothetical protein
MEFCSPAKIYAFIAFLLLLYSTIKNPDNTAYDIAFLLLKAAIFIGWTFALNKFCNLGYKYLAWIAALVPHLIYILVMIKL